MSKFILISMIVCLAFAVQQRTQSHIQYQHFLDGQLCKKRGGYVCGFVNKDCCVKGCDSKVFGMNEECIDGKHLDLSNAPDCKQLCTKSNGTLFKNDLLSDQQCCKTTALVDNKCPKQSIIDISTCGKDTLAGKIVGFINHHLQN